MLAQVEEGALRRERIFSPMMRDENLSVTMQELRRIERERELLMAGSDGEYAACCGRFWSASSGTRCARSGCQQGGARAVRRDRLGPGCLHLAAEALGPENVHASACPTRPATRRARPMPGWWRRRCGINFDGDRRSPPMVDAYFDLFPDADNMRRGNKMARERMTILFDHSAACSRPGAGDQQQDRAAARATAPSTATWRAP